MKLDIKIGYFGQKKSGKSSIISYMFNNMSRKQTLNLAPTNNPTVIDYESTLLKISNFEIPGKFESFEKLSPEDFERLKQQDAFIYVFDLRSGDPEAAVRQLKNQFKTLTTYNPHFLFYIFFHQADLDFLYLGNRVDETISVFRRKFEDLIKEDNFDLKILDRYHTKKTSIYDLTINAGELKSAERRGLQYFGGARADNFHHDLERFQNDRPRPHLPLRHHVKDFYREGRRARQRLVEKKISSSCSWKSFKCISTSLPFTVTRSSRRSVKKAT